MALTAGCDYLWAMSIAVNYAILEQASWAVTALALAAAIFFWGRGLRAGRASDLIAGPTVLAVLAAIVLATGGSSAAFATVGALVAVFGVATVLLSFFLRPGSRIAKRDALAIGVGAVILGFCLSLVL